VNIQWKQQHVMESDQLVASYRCWYITRNPIQNSGCSMRQPTKWKN
jgi:hypothetical protein